jgi:hypothetical protein
MARSRSRPISSVADWGLGSHAFCATERTEAGRPHLTQQLLYRSQGRRRGCFKTRLLFQSTARTARSAPRGKYLASPRDRADNIASSGPGRSRAQ